MTLSATQRTSPAFSVGVLLGLFLLCYGVAALGAVFSASEIPTWYAALTKPAFNPPNWIFAPVWTTLYGLMAIAAWLVWRTPKLGLTSGFRRAGLIWFTAQLALNAAWTPLFFRFHQLLAALFVILCLWIAILMTLFFFWKAERFAGAIMLPYIAWVSFAAALNYQIYRLN